MKYLKTSIRFSLSMTLCGKVARLYVSVPTYALVILGVTTVTLLVV